MDLGKRSLYKLFSSLGCLLHGVILGCIVCIGATIDLFSSVKKWHIARKLLSCCQAYRQNLSNGTADATQQELPNAATNAAARNQPMHRSPYQEEFKVAITGHNAISIEILDGGVCLENSSEDILEDAPLTRIQQAIQGAIDKTDTAIEKLDLFASHFRANLTAPMMANVLQVLPPLKHLQLGGLCLPVQELCHTLVHPSLTDLSHLALYDLVFLGTPANGIEITTNLSLALEEIVAVFIRLEDQDVSLDPLLSFLQSAPRLKQFELVMDHSHAYLHGYPRQEQPAQRQKVLFSATTFSKLLKATSNHLQLLFLEYVPLTTEHYQVMADHAKALTQLRLRDDPDISGRMEDAERLKALATLLRHHANLQTVTLDGLWSSSKQQTEALEIFQVLPLSTTINALRLRSLPMQLSELKTLLRNNTTLQNLSLHNIAFATSASATHQGTVEEEAVFAVLVQILKKDNSTLRRITWKQAEFRRTEIFPRHRKPKTYKCFRKHNQQSAQQQLHWYLTLNQRGMRFLMADIDCSRHDFLNSMTKQQRPPHVQLFGDQAGKPQSQPFEKIKGNLDTDTQEDGYALDCLYHMLSNNPSLCF